MATSAATAGIRAMMAVAADGPSSATDRLKETMATPLINAP